MAEPQPFMKPEEGSPAGIRKRDADGKKTDGQPVITPESGDDEKQQPAPLINPSGGGGVTR